MRCRGLVVPRSKETDTENKAPNKEIGSGNQDLFNYWND